MLGDECAADPPPRRSMPAREPAMTREPPSHGRVHRPSNCRPARTAPPRRPDRRWRTAASRPSPADRTRVPAVPEYGRTPANPDICASATATRQRPTPGTRMPHPAASANGGPRPCHARTPRATRHPRSLHMPAVESSHGPFHRYHPSRFAAQRFTIPSPCDVSPNAGAGTQAAAGTVQPRRASCTAVPDAVTISMPLSAPSTS